jgi:outer membrane protein assembly factor BamB
VKGSKWQLLIGVLAGPMWAACGIIQPVGEPSQDTVSVDWVRQLYTLEWFSTEPRETGTPLFIKGPMTPDGGLTVVPSKDRRVRALHGQTGDLVWEFSTQGPNAVRPVKVEDDLLIGSMDGRVYRIRQRNGRAVWKSDLVGAGAIMAAPVWFKEQVFVTSADDRLTALSLSTGKTMWQRERSASGEFSVTGHAGPLVVGDRVVTGFSDGKLMAFATSDGATVWSVDLSGGATEFADVDSTPVMTDGVLVASGYQTGLYGLDADTGITMWFLPGQSYGNPVEREGTVYVPQASGRLIAVDAATGEEKWSLGVTQGVPRTPVVSHKYVLLPVDSALLVTDRGSGRVVEQYDDMYGFTATPELAWGTLYAQSNSGCLYALGLY